MRLESIFYRSRQFWQAIYAVPDPEDLSLASSFLNSDQFRLFTRMQKSEQAHSLLVFKRLYAEISRTPADCDADLLAAALLHDVGKSCYPLSLWERVLIVLAKVFFPGQTQVWGATPSGRPSPNKFGWQRPFMVAEQHPRWGAEMAEKVGCSPLTVALIRRHQDVLQLPVTNQEDLLLYRLQSVDGSY